MLPFIFRQSILKVILICACYGCFCHQFKVGSPQDPNGLMNGLSQDKNQGPGITESVTDEYPLLGFATEAFPCSNNSENGKIKH
jgi:hypothetical protein